MSNNDKFIDKNELKEKIKRILFACRQDTIPEAILADLVDDIPIIGDITNFMRVKDAIKKHDELAYKLQMGDFIGGIIPAIGEVWDVITPTNTILTAMKLGYLPNVNIDFKRPMLLKRFLNRGYKKW